MMMKEQFKTRKEGGRVIARGMVALVLIIVAFFAFRFDAAIRDVFFNFSAPVNTSAEYGLLSKNALVARLRDADRELSRVRYANVVTDLLAEENQKLRVLLRANSINRAVVGRVLARPPQTHYDSLVIDVGSGSGIAAGDTVFVDSIALGRIASAGATTSLVELFSNPGTERDVLIGNPQSVAIARGLGGGAFELAIPQEVEVAVGDIVRMPATPSLALGIVVEITSKPTDVSKIVRFAAPLSSASLDFVEITPSSP